MGQHTRSSAAGKSLCTLYLSLHQMQICTDNQQIMFGGVGSGMCLFLFLTLFINLIRKEEERQSQWISSGKSFIQLKVSVTWLVKGYFVKIQQVLMLFLLHVTIKLKSTNNQESFRGFLFLHNEIKRKNIKSTLAFTGLLLPKLSKECLESMSMKLNFNV